jgi:NAD(P)-dependent dehydrogenase (short-subunit alcohol dehydrogenase family)
VTVRSTATAVDGTLSRIALVTGGSHRLGRHLALSLSRRGYGIVINYRRSQKAAEQLADEIARSGRYARAVRADISDKVDVASMFASIEENEGRLDLLINNVGNYEPEHLRHVTPEDWDDCIQANLNGTFYCCYHARPLLELTRGQIITIGYAGVDALVSNPWATAYQVSKTGLLVLTKSLAEALAPRVRANMVSPGQLENSVDLPQDLPAAIPMARAATLDDIAQAVDYLLDADYVTGVNIDVAGGYRLAGN